MVHGNRGPINMVVIMMVKKKLVNIGEWVSIKGIPPIYGGFMGLMMVNDGFTNKHGDFPWLCEFTRG